MISEYVLPTPPHTTLCHLLFERDGGVSILMSLKENFKFNSDFLGGQRVSIEEIAYRGVISLCSSTGNEKQGKARKIHVIVLAPPHPTPASLICSASLRSINAVGHTTSFDSPVGCVVVSSSIFK